MMQNQLYQIQSFLKKTQKDPNTRSNHEIPKSKIGERETEESKKQKRGSIQKKERVPSAQ